MPEMNWENLWSDEELYALQLEAVNAFLKCDAPETVEMSVEFAKFLNHVGLNADNYSIFLELLREENSHVTDALLGNRKAFDFFKEIQPSYYLIDVCFKMLYSYSVGGVYDKTLELIFGIIYRNYHRAREGFLLYPLSVENLNSIGKFLDKSKGQNEGNNRFIVDILGDIAEYTSQDQNNPVNEISSHAIAIRNAFFDRRREMKSVIPEEVLFRKNYAQMRINPRKPKAFVDKMKVNV